MILEIRCVRLEPDTFVDRNLRQPRRWVIWFWRVQGGVRQDSYESIVYKDQV